MSKSLYQFIPDPVIAVAAKYTHKTLADIDVYICLAHLDDDNCIALLLREVHSLNEGDLVTVHLDNRTGVSEYDADLSVYRLSYNGKVSDIDGYKVKLLPLEFQVFYGISIVFEYRENDYKFPTDNRQKKPFSLSPLLCIPKMDDDEHDNKVGVLISKAQDQPHTTVMAFLSSMDDDIFFITLPDSFKSQLLKRNSECYFVIDNRANFTFENYVKWNYTII